MLCDKMGEHVCRNAPLVVQHPGALVIGSTHKQLSSLSATSLVKLLVDGLGRKRKQSTGDKWVVLLLSRRSCPSSF